MRIVIGEDSALFREGLERLLEDAGHDVVAAAPDAPQSLTAIRSTLPDVAVLDIRMPPDLTDDGARAAAIARDEQPGLGIVLLSQHIETRHTLGLVGRGRFGYLLKDRVLAFDDFLDALERVAAGGTALDADVVTRLVGVRAAEGRLGALSPREREVLALIAEGHTNAGIAERLWLTERTVESHVGSIFGKLRLEASDSWNRRVLAVIAYLESAT
ncbi:response regulator transcription factor [Agromyces sp. NPDC056965]|uniref:response regulator transcription factor n=1 Tax=Agromyces sp. NPDC056965 TaxID=3345983 RepID=UPI003639BA98